MFVLKRVFDEDFKVEIEEADLTWKGRQFKRLWTFAFGFIHTDIQYTKAVCSNVRANIL